MAQSAPIEFRKGPPEHPAVERGLPLLALPWCCVVPILVSLLGAGSAGVAAALAPFTPAFLALSIGLVGWSNYRVHTHSPSLRARLWVAGATVLSAGLWLWSLNQMGWLGFRG